MLNNNECIYSTPHDHRWPTPLADRTWTTGRDTFNVFCLVVWTAIIARSTTVRCSETLNAGGGYQEEP